MIRTSGNHPGTWAGETTLTPAPRRMHHSNRDRNPPQTNHPLPLVAARGLGDPCDASETFTPALPGLQRVGRRQSELGIFIEVGVYTICSANGFSQEVHGGT